MGFLGISNGAAGFGAGTALHTHGLGWRPAGWRLKERSTGGPGGREEGVPVDFVGERASWAGRPRRDERMRRSARERKRGGGLREERKTWAKKGPRKREGFKFVFHLF